MNGHVLSKTACMWFLAATFASAQQPKETNQGAFTPAVRYEYAILLENKVLKTIANNEPRLKWRAPGEKRVEAEGKDIHKQLLKELGQEVESASLYDLLNHLGNKGWELCTVLPVLPPSDSQVNYVTQYVFKRVRASDSK